MMQFIIKLLLIVGISFSMYSCSRIKKGTDKGYFTGTLVDFDLQAEGKSILMSDFIDTVETICLQIPDSKVIGRATRVCFDDNDIFILDRMQQKIFHFDVTGKFLNELTKQGNGPGEYLGIYSCIVQDGILYAFDKMKQDILLYDYSFNFIRTIHCEVWAENIFLLPDGSFLCFTPQYLYNAPNGIWKMSDTGKYIRQLYGNDEKYPLVGSEWDPFYLTSSGNVGLKTPVTNEFYRYQDDSLSCVMKWHVQSKTALDFPGMENCLSVDESFWTCPIFWDTDRWLLGIWGEYNGVSPEKFSLYSKQQDKMYISSSLTVDVGDLLLMGNPVSANIPNAMVAIVDEAGLSKMNHKKHNGFLLDNQNLLLIFHFK